MLREPSPQKYQFETITIDELVRNETPALRPK